MTKLDIQPNLSVFDLFVKVTPIIANRDPMMTPQNVARIFASSFKNSINIISPMRPSVTIGSIDPPAANQRVGRNQYCAAGKLFGGSASLDPPYIFFSQRHEPLTACLVARRTLGAAPVRGGLGPLPPGAAPFTITLSQTQSNRVSHRP